MRAPLVLVLGAALIALPSAASPQGRAQPFGLTLGMSDSAIHRVIPGLSSTKAQYIYSTESVPRSHPAFESYLLVITPGYGLCKVIAIGKTIERDAFGTDTRSAFADLQTAISAKYGKPRVFDYLKAGSIWKDPREWMMAVYQKERTLAAIWPEEGKTTVGQGLSAISLTVYATSSSDGYLNLAYESDSFAQCRAELKQGGEDAL